MKDNTQASDCDAAMEVARSGNTSNHTSIEHSAGKLHANSRKRLAPKTCIPCIVCPSDLRPANVDSAMDNLGTGDFVQPEVPQVIQDVSSFV